MTIPPDMERWRESNRKGRAETAETLGVTEAEAALKLLSPTLKAMFEEVRFHHTLNSLVYGDEDFTFSAHLMAETWGNEDEAYGVLGELELAELVESDENDLWRVSMLGKEAIYRSSE